jgi:hypothetical protein
VYGGEENRAEKKREKEREREREREREKRESIGMKHIQTLAYARTESELLESREKVSESESEIECV